MKDDYLWNKGGGDAEIERLENLLQAFRHRETAPPALPAKVLSFRKERFGRIFPFVFAAAACLAFAAAGLGIWIHISGNKNEVNKELAKTTSTSNSIPAAETGIEKITESSSKKTDVLTEKNNEKPQLSEVRKIIKIRRSTPFAVRQNAGKNRNLKTAGPEIQFTDEERYAYEQLRLALSITSSKLKLVKDKVDGVDEKSDARANLR